MSDTLDPLEQILKAVYGAGRNSRLKLSDHETLDTWMSVDQAEQAILQWISDGISDTPLKKVEGPDMEKQYEAMKHNEYARIANEVRQQIRKNLLGGKDAQL